MTVKRIYTLGDFVRELLELYGYDTKSLDEVNIQSDEALESLNRCLPRNLMVRKLFTEDEEGMSVLDTPTKCIHCGETLVFLRDRGWAHLEGGVYMMYCPECGWRGSPYPSPAECPHCGSKQIRDDHCALPKLSE